MSDNDIHELSFGRPLPLIRTMGNDYDYNWLWRRKDDPKYKEIIKFYFFSPIISRRVSRILSDNNKVELIKLRRVIVKLYNVRSLRKNLTTAEALSEPLIDDVIGIILDYNGGKKK